MTIGDFVQLNSGGPVMRITEMSVAGPTLLALCVWQGMTGGVGEWFNTKMLELVDLQTLEGADDE